MIMDRDGYEAAVAAVMEMGVPELVEYLDGLYGRDSLPRSITVEILREEALAQTERVFGPDYERYLLSKKVAFRQALIPPHLEHEERNLAMQPHISIITLGVKDLKRSTKFYRDGLGLPAHGEFEGVTFFKLRGAWLSLYPCDELAADAQVPSDGNGFRAFTIAHNVQSKTEVDAVLSQAEAAGAKITKPARDTDWGGYSGYFSDLDGFLWEVAWNPHFDLT